MEVTGDNSLWFDFWPVIVQNHVKAGRSISYNGVKQLPGLTSQLHEIEIQTKDYIRRFLFNTKSYLLEAVFFPETDIFWFFANYKDISGYLMPTFVGGSRNGYVFAEETYHTIVFDQAISEEKFQFK